MNNSTLLVVAVLGIMIVYTIFSGGDVKKEIMVGTAGSYASLSECNDVREGLSVACKGECVLITSNVAGCTTTEWDDSNIGKYTFLASSQSCDSEITSPEWNCYYSTTTIPTTNSCLESCVSDTDFPKIIDRWKAQTGCD